MKTLGLFQELADAAIEFMAVEGKGPYGEDQELGKEGRLLVRAGARSRLTKALHDSAPLLPHQTAARIRQVLATRSENDKQRWVSQEVSDE